MLMVFCIFLFESVRYGIRDFQEITKPHSLISEESCLLKEQLDVYNFLSKIAVILAMC